MRFVIYDDESLEPITVLNLPLTDRDIQDRYRVWRVPVPRKPDPWVRPSEPPTYEKVQVVELEFERFVRNSPRHGHQESWFCFTRATELAMLLNPSWLPGQSRAIDYLMRQNDALTQLLMESLAR